MQAQNIKTRVVGQNRRISFDMGLYQTAKKLQMTRQELGHIILRPGELHIVMAQLRTSVHSSRIAGWTCVNSSGISMGLPL